LTAFVRVAYANTLFQSFFMLTMVHPRARAISSDFSAPAWEPGTQAKSAKK
jgi:hypothetical protein